MIDPFNIPPPPQLTDAEVRGVGRALVMRQILGAIALALTPEGTDPSTIPWTELPRLVYELQAEIENSRGMVESVLRHRHTDIKA